LGLLLQASLVVRHSPAPVAEAFLASRLAYETDRTFGTLPAGIDCQAIIERHRPKLAGG
jgi:putative acyl-CoA dehydrogenase